MAPTLKRAGKETTNENINRRIPLAFSKKRSSLPTRNTRTTRSKLGVMMIPVLFKLSTIIPES